jgi:hypothetical protein
VRKQDEVVGENSAGIEPGLVLFGEHWENARVSGHGVGDDEFERGGT